MALTKVRSSGNQTTPNLSDIGEGERVVWSHSVTREQVDPDSVETVQDTIENYVAADWVIKIQSDRGWEQVGVERGCPEDYRLRENYGSGKFQCIPLNASGKPVERFVRTRLVAALSQLTNAAQPVPSPTAAASISAADDLPASVRIMIAQQAEERAEARRAAGIADRKREEWEAKQAQREWDRQEREERLSREKREQDADDRRAAADRQDKLIQAGLLLAGTLVTAFAGKREETAAPRRDVNDALLAALMQATRPPERATSSIKDSMDMLMVLDQLADRRAERVAPPQMFDRGDRDDPPEDEGLGKALMSLLPVLLQARNGGGQVAQNALEQMASPQPDMRGIAEQAVTSILRDPDALAAIASRDPEGTAKVFLAAVKRNPSLQAAVAAALAEGDDEEPDEDDDPEEG